MPCIAEGSVVPWLFSLLLGGCIVVFYYLLFFGFLVDPVYWFV